MHNTEDRALDCMSVVVGKNASKTGHVLVAHNEDDYVHAKVRHYYVPARSWPEGTLLPAEEGRRRIPQVKHTLGYWWSEIIGQEGGLSTSDAFLNEKGVCVVSDSSCGSRIEAEMGPYAEDGIAYELRRAVAERAETARQGFEIAKNLIETYGYASAGRIYIIADKDEAFTVQAVQGRLYAAARIPDDAVMVMPNHYTIRRPADAPETCFAPGLISLATEKGWYQPKTPGDDSDFDFAAVFQDPKTWRHEENTLRQKYATQMLTERVWNEETDDYVLCVNAEKKIGVDDLMRVMSTHYEGTKDDVRFGPGEAPHDTAVRRVCTGTTVEADIYDFADVPLCTTVWTAYGRPCELPFIPQHPLAGVPRDLEIAIDPFEAAEKHLGKQPFATVYESGYWQLMKDCENLLEYRYRERIDETARIKEGLFHTFAAGEEALRKALWPMGSDEALSALQKADSEALREAANAVCRMIYGPNGLANAAIYIVSVRRLEAGAEAEVVFSCPGEPFEDSLLFGPGRTEMNKSHAKAVPGSLQKLNGAWRALFRFEKPPLEKDGAGTYEFIIGGRCEKGSFAGICLTDMNEEGSGQKAAWWTESSQNVFVAAHRGWSALYPENTMEAFVAAVALGVDQIETDVRMTKDGTLVLMHDSDAVRTTDSSGRIEDMTLEEVRSLDAGAKKGFPGAQVPLLKELLELASHHPYLTLDVELKEYPEDVSQDMAFEACDKTVGLLKAYGLLDRTVINTFSGQLHEYLKNKYPGIRRHEYYPPKHMRVGDDHDYAGAYCCCMFSAHGERMADQKEFEMMRSKGVEPWAGAAVCNEEGVNEAVEKQAPLITCNDPALILSILRAQGCHR